MTTITRYNYEEFGISFNVLNSDKTVTTYVLQLPISADSQIWIDDEHIDRELSTKEEDIINQCVDYYYSSFASKELAAASALVSEEVTELVEKDDFFLIKDKIGNFIKDDLDLIEIEENLRVINSSRTLAYQFVE